MRITVNFIGIGAQKAGTSWLYNQFKKSSQTHVFPLKEIHYFDRCKDYDSPNFLSQSSLFLRLFDLKWVYISLKLLRKKRKEFKWYWSFLTSYYNDDWYLSLYKNIEKCKGEITPSYAILKEKDIIKMRDLLGRETKIIFMIRNPIDRAWSSYKYWHRGKYVEHIDDTHAKQFFCSDHQKQRSDYITTLENYKKHFDSICVCFFDAILDNPQLLLKQIFDYLELDTTEVATLPKVDKQVNYSKLKSIPNHLEEFLKEMYADELMKMAHYFGSYTKYWDGKVEDQTNLNPTLIVSDKSNAVIA